MTHDEKIAVHSFERLWYEWCSKYEKVMDAEMSIDFGEWSSPHIATNRALAYDAYLRYVSNAFNIPPDKLACLSMELSEEWLYHYQQSWNNK